MIVEASDILSCVGTVNVLSEWDCRARQPGLARPGRRAERDSAATNLKLLQQIQNTATDAAHSRYTPDVASDCISCAGLKSLNIKLLQRTTYSWKNIWERDV